MTKPKKNIDWIPKQQLRFNLWQKTFMNEIQDPVIAPLTGIPSVKLTALLALQTAYQNAFANAPPHTHAGHPFIAARNEARKAYIDGPNGIRKIGAQYLRHNDALSTQQKIDIGILSGSKTGTITHSVHGENTARTVADYPAIQVKSNSVGTVTFTFHETGSPISRGKEAGMHHCLIQYIILATTAPPPAGEDACPKHIEAQRSPFTKDVTRENSGLRLWGFAAWVDTRGVIHAWSPPFSCIIT